jgi:hypothetical protein
MHEDIRVTLRQKGFIRQPDGSYSKADSLAPRPSHPVVEHDAGRALVNAPPDEAGRGPRLVLRFTRFAVSLLDFDNGAGGCKFLCDALRYEKLIPDDDPGSIDFQFRQVKVDTFAEEGVEIVIEPGVIDPASA